MTRDEREPIQDQLDAVSERVDELTHRVDGQDDRADATEAQADVDREILASLQIDESLAREHVDQLQRALHTSRTIGAAIGLVMSRNNVDRDHALEILKAASSRGNVKLQVLCDDIVSGRRAAL